MGRIIFIDLQNNGFLLRNVDSIKHFNKLKTYKHKYLLEFANKNHLKIFNYIPATASTGIKGNIFDSNFVKTLLCKYVLIKNKLNPFGIKVIHNIEFIENDDIVIAYYYNVEQMKHVKFFDCVKVVMGQHFIALSSSPNLAEQNIDYFVNEIQLSNNQFINKYFNLDGVQSIIMPYVFAERFKQVKQFQERLNKAMAIGTLSTVAKGGYTEYLKYAGTPWVQPMRKEIYDQKEAIADYLDSYISYIYEDKLYKIDSKQFKLMRIYKRIWNWFHEWRQSSYFSFDMVEKFNQYKMFVCPEEYVGMPGIGFVEGMACGCAYIGIEHEMYQSLGLIPQIHYISYDGTISGLAIVIKYYQEHEKELEIIAKTGMDFVRSNFNGQVVADNFFRDIKIATN